MFLPFWGGFRDDAVMLQVEYGFEFASDESSTLLHRLIRAVGGEYDLSHNYWGRA